MAFSGNNAPAVSSMNVVPLIDVLIVLLVIFMVTAPLVETTLAVGLQPGPPAVEPQPEPIRLGIADSGELSWNGTPLPDAALAATLRVEAARSPQPTIELDAADQARYQRVATVLAETRRAGLATVGFTAR